MYKSIIIKTFFIFILFPVLSLNAQQSNTDAMLHGHVVSEGIHVPFINVVIKGTTIGTVTDETGHYQLANIPEGTYILIASGLGFKPKEELITISRNKSVEIKFDLKADRLGLEEVVVTGDRNARRRSDAPVIVNTLTPALFGTTQSVTLSEGLNFVPGLRTENNCSNCGFSQVRMNGMEGPYSQILVNSRPIFSGLAGVYGLELIPSSMIERIEVVRGGGSALYGSNAIAGTINLILKDPVNNSFEAGISGGLTGVGISNSGNPANDYNINLNTSMVSDDGKTGFSIYGFHRMRDPFDANADDFTELTSIKNTTIGGRVFRRIGYRSKLAIDFFNINEDRRGGNKHDMPEHMADIAESAKHNILTGAATYEKFFREEDKLSLYISGQSVNRDTYYGAEQSLQDYGMTRDFSHNLGGQYSAVFNNSGISFGIENQGSRLHDQKPGYPDIQNATIVNDSIQEIPYTENTDVADQRINTFGLFAQYDYSWNKLNVAVGARFDSYQITDKHQNAEDKTGNVLSPRVTLKYDLLPNMQARVSYSQGYRAPQIFDEDLHIETSGSRKVIHANDPNLKQETSHSYMASVDYNTLIGTVNFGVLAEGFHTTLVDAFANEYGTPDENGTVIYTRVNSEGGATVQGVNLEAKMKPHSNFELIAGFTIQSSRFEETQEFDEKRFVRTPDEYGYIALDWDFLPGLCFSTTMNYTGKMLIPYFGPELGSDEAMEAGELRQSDRFFDMGTKLAYKIDVDGISIEFYGGLKNIFNSYQTDHDYGIYKDPGYIYGPANPRSVYFGIRLGNLLK